MKTHRAAFEGGFFLTALLWFSLHKDRNEYGIITMQAKASSRVLGVSLEKFDLICGGNDFKEVMLKGMDELKVIAMEVEARYDELHAHCFNLGMHCSNLLGVTTFGSHVPNSQSVLPLYIQNIAKSEACIPVALPPVVRIRTLAPEEISFDTLISLVQEVAELIEKYVTQTKKVNILVVFANPKGSNPLRLENEDRVIRECKQLSLNRDHINLNIMHATRVDDFARALLEKEYQIVHFSGHGTGKGLAFENEIQEVQIIPKEALSETLSAYSPPIECVLLNACYSGVHAKSLSMGVKYTVVMKGPISDKSATEFTRGFYDAIGAGKDIEFSYKEGCRRIKLKGLPDALTPILITK